MKKSEYQKQWELDNREKRLEYKRKYYQSHKDDAKKRYQEKRDEILAKRKERYELKKDEIKERLKSYNKTKYGRALYLLGGYRRLDKESSRGECTLTARWIVDNIFSNTCVYCGEKDWTKLGCDRKDSGKPHTEDNCVPCCQRCNCKKKNIGYDDYINKNKTVKIDETDE